MWDERSENDRIQPRSELAYWPGIIAGLPVLLFGLAFVLAHLLGNQAASAQAWLLFGAESIVLIGVVIGWLGWFPIWTYAFVGMAVLFSLWWSTATAGTDRLLSGALAWSPLLVAAALGLLLSRSFRPVLKFIQGFLRDWSLASLSLYSVLPVAMYAAMSVVPPANAILYQCLAVLILAAGAGISGLAIHPSRRGRILLLGMSWAWIVITLGVTVYWHGRSDQLTRPTNTWFDQVLGMSLLWMILALIVFFPAGLAMLGRLARRVTDPVERD